MGKPLYDFPPLNHTSLFLTFAKKTMSSPFSKSLLRWFDTEKRDLPWKETKDPYKIWISEIILQQTRVAQGLPYYMRFITRFPDVITLANAPQDEVLKLWEGLGYYSRARNLHHAAQLIRDEYKGNFPATYEEVLALKGIGAYTAAAIMSFAYGKAYPVLDGNVKRVVARYLGIHEPADLPATQKTMMAWLKGVISKSKADDFNQALLDLGATICVPQNPLCNLCPVAYDCVAKKEELQGLLPVKSKVVKKRNRFFHYFIILNPAGQILIEQRKEKDIWQGLYQFPMIESLSDTSLKKKEILAFLKELGLKEEKFELKSIEKAEKPHILTHQSIYAQYYLIIHDENILKISNKHIFFVDRGKLSNFAFPRLLHKVLENPALWQPGTNQSHRKRKSN